MTSLLSLIGVLHANYWGARWLDEPLGQNIGGGLEPLGPHEVGAYASRNKVRVYVLCSNLQAVTNVQISSSFMRHIIGLHCTLKVER